MDPTSAVRIDDLAAGDLAPDHSVLDISSPAAIFSPSRSEFGEFMRFACAKGVVPDGVNLLLKGLNIFAGLGQLRESVGPHLYVRLPASRQRFSQINLLEIGNLIAARAPDAEVLVEPGFARVPLEFYRAAPLRFINSIVFRVIENGAEVFRADLRQGNRTHRTAARIFAFNEQYDLAHELTELLLDRKVRLSDLDRDVVEPFVAAGGRCHDSLPKAVAPRADFDPAWLQPFDSPFTLAPLSPERSLDKVARLRTMADRVYERARLTEDLDTLALLNTEGVFMIRTHGPRALRRVHSFVEDTARLIDGSIELRPPHHIWMGFRYPGLTPRTFLRQASALQTRHEMMRFEVREMRPLLRHDEFRELAAHPELAFKTADSDVVRNRTIIALNGTGGYFVQYNPSAALGLMADEIDQFVRDPEMAHAALRSCNIIVGRMHPNLPERTGLMQLLPIPRNEYATVVKLAEDILKPLL
ncbi:MAG: hypothetical protein K1X83_13370 [Oligoflexia bacterium]|nr:hypothetical protein [Oligoflexia bacterium]